MKAVRAILLFLFVCAYLASGYSRIAHAPYNIAIYKSYEEKFFDKFSPVKKNFIAQKRHLPLIKNIEFGKLIAVNNLGKQYKSVFYSYSPIYGELTIYQKAPLSDLTGNKAPPFLS